VLDLTGLPALDLAIGLAFIFFLLSTLALTIQEFIAAILGLRARTLEQGLRSLLEDPKKGWKYVDKFYEHDLIKSLYRTPPPFEGKGAKTKAPGKETLGKNAHVASRRWPSRALAFFKRTSGPSYISPRSFALVVLDNLAPDKDQKTIFDQGNKVVDELPAGIRARLKPLLVGAETDIETLRTNLEAWYDDTMARVSGWYKRKTQIILIVVGVLLVPAINANTIKLGERMWKDDTVRAAVVAQSQASTTSTSSGQGAQAQGQSEATKQLNAAANDVDRVAKLGIPLGWSGETVPDGAGEIAIAIAGWTLTILAISLGAPFWFDTLSRFSRLRSSGKPETPLPASASGRLNERVLTPPQVPTVIVQNETASPPPPARGSGSGPP
jgi:hypothetical protein